MRRFFITPERISAAGPESAAAEIGGEDAHHIRHVLRMAAGDPLIVFDGTGKEYDAVIEAVSADAVRLRLTLPKDASRESSVDLTVAQGLLKEKKMDVLVRHLTELGMTRWVPFQAERSIPRYDGDKRRARAGRWEKIARESLKQCGRSRAPEISQVVRFDEMLAAAEGCALKLFFWERAAAVLPDPPTGGTDGPLSVFIVLGPEGGFSAAEAQRARDAGFALVTLGPRILRAETAAVAACAIAQYRYGDMAVGRPKTP